MLSSFAARPEHFLSCTGHSLRLLEYHRRFAMVGPFCIRKLEANAKLVQFNASFVIAFCVINLLFSFLAILANLLSIYALWKASSIPATLKKLFLSLAVSDLNVGVFGQLAFAIISALMLKVPASESFFCPTFLTAYYFCLFLLVCSSFLNVTAIAVDRLLVIFLHLRYQELMTPARVVVGLISLWLTSGVFASVFILLPSRNNYVSVVAELSGILVTTVAYIYVYKVVRYHQNQIQNQNGALPDHAMEVHREQKSSFNVLFIYVVFLVCNLPNLFCALLGEADRFRMASLVANHVTVFLVLLNSSLNPLIYCWRYREIREIVRSTVEKACPFA